MDRWQQIESLFERVIALPPSEREAYLRAACTHDSDLYREVASLIAYDDNEAQQQSWAATAAAQLVVPDAFALERVGRLTPGTVCWGPTQSWTSQASVRWARCIGLAMTG